MSRIGLSDKVEKLRTLEVSLYTRHREEQQFNLETYGAREYDGTEPTFYSRAAEALGGLLDGLEDIIQESYDAEGVAVAMGDYSGESATMLVGFVIDTLDKNLPEEI
jgi:hypothetical protein